MPWFALSRDSVRSWTCWVRDQVASRHLWGITARHSNSLLFAGLRFSLPWPNSLLACWPSYRTLPPCHCLCWWSLSFKGLWLTWTAASLQILEWHLKTLERTSWPFLLNKGTLHKAKRKIEGSISQAMTLNWRIAGVPGALTSKPILLRKQSYHLGEEEEKDASESIWYLVDKEGKQCGQRRHDTCQEMYGIKSQLLRQLRKQTSPAVFILYLLH